MQLTKRRTADEAIGRWPGILLALGVDARFLQNKHGPCPVCQGKDRYRFDNKAGRGTWFCSHCGSGDGFELLRKLHGWSFFQAAEEVDRVIGTVPVGVIAKEQADEGKLRALQDVWAAGRPIVKGDPVWLYLNRRLGIDIIPDDLRFHPSLPHTNGGMHPSMLALMRYPDGKQASIHRTYLTGNGQKANVSEVRKFMPGKPLSTASVRLESADTRLGIAEGIETALAASKRFGLPVWAAANAVLLEMWVPPTGIKEILVAGDNDKSFTGQAAAFALARRLVREGFAVEVQIPDEPGKDWADESI